MIRIIACFLCGFLIKDKWKPIFSVEYVANLPWWMSFPLTVTEQLKDFKVIFFLSINRNSHELWTMHLAKCTTNAKTAFFSTPNVPLSRIHFCYAAYITVYRSTLELFFLCHIEYQFQIWYYFDQLFFFSISKSDLNYNHHVNMYTYRMIFEF